MAFRAGPAIPSVSTRTITPFGPETLGLTSMQMILGAYALAAYPAANVAIFVPMEILQRAIVYEVFWETGSAPTGNIDIGIYDRAGTRLASLGSTAIGSASSLNNSTTWTDYTLEPGFYYMAFAHDGTSSLAAVTSPAGLLEACGVCEQTSAFALPATATLSRTTRAHLPHFGLTVRTEAL